MSVCGLTNTTYPLEKKKKQHFQIKVYSLIRSCLNFSIFFKTNSPVPAHISKENVPEIAMVGRLIKFSWGYLVISVSLNRGGLTARREKYFMMLEIVYLWKSIFVGN